MSCHGKVFDEIKIFIALFGVAEVSDEFGDFVVRLESVVRSHVSEIGGLASGAGLLGCVGSHERPGTGKIGLERSSSFIGLFKVSLGGGGARFLTGPGVDEGTGGGGVGIFALGVVGFFVSNLGRFAGASGLNAGAFGILLSKIGKRRVNIFREIIIFNFRGEKRVHLLVDLSGDSVSLIARLSGLQSPDKGDAGDTANVGGIGGFHESQSGIEQSLFGRGRNGGHEGYEKLK